MTRRNPTPAELEVGSALLRHLEDAGNSVSEPIFDDRPDLRFTLNGVRTACEFVQIPPASILNFVHSRFKQLEGKGAKAVRVVWPQEQNAWVHEAIASKRSKLSAYKRNANVSDVSLLIHAPIHKKDDWVQTKDPIIQSLIRSGVQNSTHGFSSIYFWSPHTAIERLAPHSPPWPSMNANLDEGYPTFGFVIASGPPFRTTAEGEPPKLYDYGEIEPEVIIVPPLSKEFRGRRPNYRNPRQRLMVLAGSTTAEITFYAVKDGARGEGDA